jgi:large subunit ribosomal protein L19
MMNTVEIINAITKDQIRTDLPELEVGSTVKVYQKIVEGSRTRTQMFEGTIIKVQGGGIAKTFTVRRLSYGVGVEKTWPVNSPNLEKIELVRRGKVRRARLFYLRDRVGKAAKVKERI